MPNRKISQFPILNNITPDVEFAVVVSGDNYTVGFDTVSGTVVNNIVFPDADVLGTRLSGFTTGLNQPLSSGDTILSAFENLQTSKQDLLTVQLTGAPESLSFIDIDDTTANVNIVSVSTGQTEINISTETSGATDSIILNENGLTIESELYGNTTSLILSDGFGISYTGGGIFNDVNGFYIKNPDKIYFPLSVISGDTLARLSDINNSGFGNTKSIFLGLDSGFDVRSGLTDSYVNYIGFEAGYYASGVTESNYIGYRAGYVAKDNQYCNFIGHEAGYDVTGQTATNLIGYFAGNNSDDVDYSNFIGSYAGNNAKNANGSNFIGQTAGTDTSGATNCNFIGNAAGDSAINVHSSNFIGDAAGNYVTDSIQSNFIGKNAGVYSYNMPYSNFIGVNAGDSAFDSISANFIGYYAGHTASGSTNSNFIGTSAGDNAVDANNSNFFGSYAGESANNANASNFIGYYAGYRANNANYSNFIGYQAGYGANVANNSIFIGNKAGKDNGAPPNSIIIGNNITLPFSTGSTMNIGGVLFGSGLNDDLISTPIATETPNGKIGVRVVEPKSTFDVNGSFGAKYTYVDMTTLAADYTIDDFTTVYRFDYLGESDFNIILPDPATCTNRMYYISRTKDTGGGSLYVISVAGTIEDVDGSIGAIVALKPVERFQWVSDGTNWVLISSYIKRRF